LLIAAAAVIALLLIGVGVTVALTRSSSSHTTAAAETSVPATSSAASTSISQPTTQTFGRVRAQIPAGWHIASHLGDRVDLSPDNGARQRITLTQKTLNPGAGLDDVADTLDAQIKSRPAGQVSALQRNTVFGGRPGLSYEESPGDGTTVRWQILVDSGLQASVGCQYVQGNWQPLADTCEQFVHTLRITE
jgi:type VII secretion-associated protein (TIGR03931 family)